MDTPAGILTDVFTARPSGGKALRITRVATLLASVVPLRRPAEDRAAFDNQLVADLLRKDVSYVGTADFCVNLWELAKRVSDPKSTYESGARRPSFNGGTEYDVAPLLLPSVTTVVAVSRPNGRSEHRSANDPARHPAGNDEPRPRVERAGVCHRPVHASEAEVDREGWAGKRFEARRRREADHVDRGTHGLPGPE